MEGMRNKKHRRNTENRKPFISVIILNVRAFDWMCPPQNCMLKFYLLMWWYQEVEPFRGDHKVESSWMGLVSLSRWEGLLPLSLLPPCEDRTRSHRQARKSGLTKTLGMLAPWSWTQPSELWEIKVCCLGHPCGKFTDNISLNWMCYSNPN